MSDDVKPILCMGIPVDKDCAAEATTIIHLHAQVAGVLCHAHAERRVQEIIDQGHGACRTGPISSSSYPLQTIREFAEKYRGKLGEIPRGRHYRKRR